MAIRTVLTDRLGIVHPIVLAPMGGVAGGRLAAAVSNAGGLGLVGGGYGDPSWLRAELDLVSRSTERPWGVGLITWHATSEAIALALEYRPRVFMLSFGDPRPWLDRIKAAGCIVICQVQEVQAARDALAAGADVVVAQGTEAGGHGATRATLPLVPAVVDAVSPTPVLAAGGIADGRGLAAALMLGACGVLIGTRFYGAAESRGHSRAKARLVSARASETTRTRIFDVARGYAWPAGYTGRALRNDFLERWHGHEAELAASQEAREGFQAAQADGDFETAMVWAGEAVDLIHEVLPAAEIVQRIVSQATACLQSATAFLGRSASI
jgi:nitronate monooxygenase